jgi:4-amino-4-deoxy-L-arabinose transferase-like glycosyltransferase
MTPSTVAEPERAGSFGVYVWRVSGALLLLLVVIPFYRMATGPGSDRIASDVVDAANTSRALLLLGTFITLTIGILATKFLDTRRLEARLASSGHRLAAVPTFWYALSLAALAAVLCVAFSWLTLEGKPNLIDAMVQLTQARYVAAGHLGGPVDPLSEFWHLPNSMATPSGWVSQYPPGYVVLLGLGMMLGAPILVGPILLGVTVFFTALAADRLFPDDIAIARLGALMLALSPFAIGLAGAFMNHVAAAAFISIAIYCAVRRSDGGNFVWAILAGAAVGGVFAIRPLTAVVAALLVAMIWILWRAGRFRDALPGFVRSSIGAVVGIAPLIAAIAAYNQHFFGSVLRFGYSAAAGPLVGPGFHRDPSGHFYGPMQAIEYTSSDLTTLSMYLFESPIPACVVVALFLILSRDLSRGVRIVAAWALLPVLANALYWHHGIFMGPRMVNEWAPAWALLTAIAAVGLVRKIPARTQYRGYTLRWGVAVAFLLAWFAGIFYLGPQRLARYGGSYLESARMKVPVTKSPSLIFVHGGWSTRIAMRLTSHGMRGDSLEAVMALNPTCDVQAFANWYASPVRGRSGSPAQVNFDFAAGTRPQRIVVARGDEIRYDPRRPLSPGCRAQVASDTLGIIDIAPLMWQGALPQLKSDDAMIVRDMGPTENARLIARYADRVPMMMLRREKEGAPVLLPYNDGVKLLWPAG